MAVEVRRIHDLKIEKEYFNDIYLGEKSFEIRLADRDYRCGDLLLLNEIDDDKNYTGRKEVVEVNYIFTACSGDSYGLKEGYCIMAISKLHEVKYD